MTTLADFSARRLDGTPEELSAYAGKVVLVVNTASQCGLTPQLEGLEQLWRDHRDAGLVVLGFPCNQFAGQEPGNAEQIAAFCQRNYGVSFPVFEKVDVNGADAHPLYQWLKAEKGGLLGGAVKWNFTKFLVGRDGRVIRRYPPTATPQRLEKDVLAALAS